MTKRAIVSNLSSDSTKNNPEEWFSDTPVIGQLPVHRAAVKFRELGEVEEAEEIEERLEKDSKKLIRSLITQPTHDVAVKVRKMGKLQEAKDIEANIKLASEKALKILVAEDAHKSAVNLHKLCDIDEFELIEAGIERNSENAVETIIAPYALKAAKTLRKLNRKRDAKAIESGIIKANKAFGKMPKKSLFDFFGKKKRKAYMFTSHAFGYIPINELNSTSPVQIMHAGVIKADKTLKNSQIKITLDRLIVYDYPGSGTHNILCDFYAQNQLQKQTEHIHFNQLYRVQEGQQAGIIGFPVFIGLNVGREGVAFKCFTINVKNEQDEKILEYLDSDVFKSGLVLASTINPAIAPLSSLAFGITKMFAGRNKNVAVQDFFMGLDFSSVATRARLAEGSYIAVQIPEDIGWNWSNWLYNPIRGRIVNRHDHKKTIPYNYMVFGVSRFEGEDS